MDPLLLPWKHFLGRTLRRDRVPQNSQSTSTNFCNFVRNTSCTFVPNLSKIGLFIFPWQHILETALMRNGAIQLSNYVTVTLFLNQSLQTFEVFLEMISCTSVQNFSRKKCFILPLQHILLRVLMQNRVIEIIDDVTVTSFCNQSQQNIVFLVVIPRSISVQKLSKAGQSTKKLQKWQMTSFLKIPEQFLCLSSF